MLDWNITMNALELTFALGSAVLAGGLIVAFLLRSRIRQLGRLASIDDLTQLFNSMEFNRQLPLEIERARRSHQALSLVLLDIDHFKSLNDSYGYQTGDLVLREFTSLLKARVRQVDGIFRYKQGDEFAILMLETVAAGAATFTERLQTELETYKFLIGNSRQVNDSVSLTISAGIVSLDADIDTVETLIERAELALRNAKQSTEQGLSILTGYSCPHCLTSDVPELQSQQVSWRIQPRNAR